MKTTRFKPGSQRRRAFILAALALAPPVAGLDEARAAPTRGWAHDAGIENIGPNPPCLAHDASGTAFCIQQVLARWGIAYDDARMDVIQTLFTDNAVFEVYLGNAQPIVSVKGKAAVLKNVSHALGLQGDQRRHLISNVVIDAQTETEAEVSAYALVGVAGDPPTVGATVVYGASLRRANDGVWRLSRLRIGMDAYAGKPPDQAKVPDASR